MKILGVVLTAPLWGPVVLRIVKETWAVSTEDGAERRAGSRPSGASGDRLVRSASTAWPAGGPGWARHRLRNGVWDIGRRPPQRGASRRAGRAPGAGFARRPRGS